MRSERNLYLLVNHIACDFQVRDQQFFDLFKCNRGCVWTNTRSVSKSDTPSTIAVRTKVGAKSLKFADQIGTREV